MKRLFPIALFFAGALQILAQPTNTFLASVHKNFAAWDMDHDGILSVTELDAAVADPQTTGANAAAVAALKRASRLPNTTLPPFSMTNIDGLVEQRLTDLELTTDLTAMYHDALKRINAVTNRTLFPNGLPRLDAIHQGKLGNCFCLAPLGAMVNRDPAQVAAMFSAETNGDYAVRLGKKTVEVTPPTDAEIAMTSSNEHDGIWVNLYEKAVGTARNADRPADQRADSPLDALARGGSAGTMLAYITGNEITRFSFKFAKIPASATNDWAAKLADLRIKLADARRDNRLMTCGTIKPTTPGLMPNHAYAVLDYEAESDSVRLWNPHGDNFEPKAAPGLDAGYVMKKGVFLMPLEQFVQQFSGMAFEVVTANKG